MVCVSFTTRPMTSAVIRCTKKGGGVSEQRVRVTLNHLAKKKRSGEPITLATAHDYPSAAHVDVSGIDICLVGDSAAMAVHGHSTTLPITLEQMLVHCRVVSRGAKHPLLVGDLPFSTYESSPLQAVETASRFAKEGGMDAVKLEGGTKERVKAVEAIVGAGIAVMGHVGLTPQAISALGGFRAQGRSVTGAMKALVYHDIVGMLVGENTLRFCKKFGNVGEDIIKALVEYKKEVVNGSFPSHTFTPYTINTAELEGFLAELKKLGLIAAANEAASASRRFQTLCSASPPSHQPLAPSPLPKDD